VTVTNLPNVTVTNLPNVTVTNLPNVTVTGSPPVKYLRICSIIPFTSNSFCEFIPV